MLGAARIEHGVLAVEDPELLAQLARQKVCLDVCPSSNYLLRVCPSVKEHPLPKLLEAGIPVTINSDDPLLFGPNVLDEYKLCREVLGLTDEQLATSARCSFEHSCAPAELRARGIEGVEGWLAA